MQNLYEVMRRLELKKDENDSYFLTGIRESHEYLDGKKGDRNGSTLTVLLRSLNESADIYVPQHLGWKDEMYLKPVSFTDLTMGLKFKVEWYDGKQAILPTGLRGSASGVRGIKGNEKSEDA